MMRARKIRAVATHELLATVRRKAYLITTFGMPLFVLLYLGFFSMIGVVSERKQESKVRVFGVLDEAGVLGLAGDQEVEPVEIPPEIRAVLESSGRARGLEGALGVMGKTVFRPIDDRETALAEVASGDLTGMFILKPDYLETGFLESYNTDGVDIGSGDARRALGRLIGNRLLEGKVPDDVVERVRNPFADREDWTVAADGSIRPRSVAAEVTRLIVPIVFTMLLFLSLMMTASYLLQATAAEKENKVVEVLLSSANPDEILAGKLFGLGVAGMLQVVVWFGMVVVAGLVTAGTLAGFGIQVPWFGIVAAVLFFPAAYLFLGSLMLGTGALGGNLKESNQLSMIWSLPSAAPLMLLGIMISDPHGIAARILTWIPITTPATVVFRTTIDPAGMAWWEIAGPFVLMLAGTWFALRVGARLFRVGLLLTGARPKLKEILRQARLAA